MADIEKQQPPVIGSGQTPALAREIIDQSASPFCPGLSLQACPSPSADSLRQVIVAKVRAGESKDAILTMLYTDFGSAIRAAPEASGFGLVAWLAPGVFLAVSAVYLTRWLRRRTAHGRTAPVRHATSRNSAAGHHTDNQSFTAAERRELARLLRQDA